MHTTNATIYKNVLLAPYTTFKIGGFARYFAEARSGNELRSLCRWAKNKNLEFFILGSGSNVLFSDKGFDGLVIKFKPPVDREIKFFTGVGDSKVAEVSAGVLLSELVADSVKADLSGLEWAVGIPGTVGGAIHGNAGAFGGSMADSLRWINILDVNDLIIKQMEDVDCGFGYRTSLFKMSPNFIILSGVFSFKKEQPGLMKNIVLKNQKQRANSFTTNRRSAGCFFKNIDWKRRDVDKKDLLGRFPELKVFSDKPKIPAGFLIDKMKLKGKRFGGARVSRQHANFILNSGNANADQVLMLSGFIKDKIYSHYGLALEEEVRLVGF